MQPTPLTPIESAALAAMRRLTEHLNRSAAQHKRAVRKGFAALRGAPRSTPEGRSNADN